MFQVNPNIQFPNFDEGMEILGQRFVEIIKDSLMQNYPYAPGFDKNRPVMGQANLNASGSLYNSVEARYDANDQVLGILMNYYWKYVDRGRGPGKYVPIQPLVEWATLKGFENPTAAAFGISTNIKKFGIRGTQFFSMISADKVIEELEGYLTDQLGIDIETFFNAFEIKEQR
jgi:hypothetical protein